MQKVEDSAGKISVVMPLYNAEAYLAEAIDSILAQTYTNWELIIVNDASVDKSLCISREYEANHPNIQVFSLKKNMGTFYALNFGAAKATGEYYTTHDSDDISYPIRFEQQVSFLKKNPDISLVGSNIDLIDSKGQKVGYRTFPAEDQAIKKSIGWNCPFSHTSVLMKMDLFNELNGYKSDLRQSGDVDLWYRALLRAKVANLQKNLLAYRLHPNQLTQNTIVILKTVLGIQKVALSKREYRTFSHLLSYCIKWLVFQILPESQIRKLVRKIHYKQSSNSFD